MRNDLAKCTTERERTGGRGKCWKKKYGGKVRIHPDPDHDYQNEHGGFHSSARHRQLNHKEFTDRLNALKGNLRVNLGRRWDDVYSEFCAKLDRRGVSGHHIWTHLMQEVETHTYMQDGKVMEKPKEFSYGLHEVTGFYVHPETGLLCYQEPRSWRNRYKEDKAPEFLVPGNEGWQYKTFEGIWFRYKIIERKTLCGSMYRELVKRQANKREVRWIREQLAAVAQPG